MDIAKDARNSLFVDGKWLAPDGGDTVDVVNPATGETIAELGYGGAAEAVHAVDVAARAFRWWRRTTARERAVLLLQTASHLRERAGWIGRVLAMESGKRLAEAIAEVRFAAEYFRRFAEEIRRPHGVMMPGEATNKRHWTLAQPAGVALVLTPWNFPVSIQARKLAPALAAGCTVVARASQKAPLSVIELFRCLQAAGFPAGVVNLVQGPAAETTKAMMQQEGVRVVSFTGSTPVGQTLVGWSAGQLQRMALELGGNAPFIVFEDADIERAVEGAMVAKFRNNGQSCIAANRFYVHDAVYEQFVERFVARVSAMKLSDPVEDPDCDLGPVIDAEARARLKNLASDAIALGARRLVPERAVPASGYFLSPILLEDVTAETGFACEELFGPAAPIFRFREEEEVIACANSTDMGLAAYVYTESHARATRVTEALEYGIVALNHALPSVAFAPMGGWKRSGLGREGARVGLEEFQEIKYISAEI
ncbi:NAD-dependent succinate-semialdehyde dehydrogenase [Alicyclobacillus macrosporangiidus]|uniref:NAD-dependent succinate-semialdehyde dehydrogenase n=1 Tax=Alicyclobacillus macrosporangiidus TaxID=392015 RepID=UPI0004965A0A|nr:NAD-dependent succinate-semialdehyde dehydrogenase [Alicyclobacillus macrosporangiidus]